MKAYVAGEDLARIAYNGMQFVNTKSIYLPGQVFFVVSEDTIRVYSCDDYIAVSDSAPLSEDTLPDSFVISLADTKELEKFSRLNKKYRIGIEVGYGVKFSLDDSEVEEPQEIIFPLEEFHEENWDIVDYILFQTCEAYSAGEYYSRPERTANLSKLKAAKEAPIGWRHILLDGHHLLRFRLGTTISGVIKLVDETKVNEEFLWPKEVNAKP